MGAEVLIPLAGLAAVAGGIAYGVGWVRGVAAERRAAYDAWSARLADERDERAAERAKLEAERAKLEALAGWERDRCARIAAREDARRDAALTVTFGPVIARPSRAGRN